ncbi:MAG: DEAD/DEAH box helicase [Candidatus Sumerlaeia bacterium]|nr:DEAD/DEAH box helicase [Candidatus Sumerlaeia bacterium]
MTFEQLGVNPRLLALLAERGITTPTPVQAKAIPVAATGADLVATAQTGTGKTLAFGLPSIERLSQLKPGSTGMLVLTPTRELAQQVHDVLQPLAKALKLTTACVYGGVGMEPQAKALKQGATIVVACPGRLLDHMERGNARFNQVSILVMDEADRMLDMGFLPDIRRILRALPSDRQTMMFSATFPRELTDLAQTMMRSPERVEIGHVTKPADAVTQAVFAVGVGRKQELLLRLLGQHGVGTTLIFVRTKRGADKVAKLLDKAGVRAEAIHGDLSQGQRQRALDGFRTGKHKILVATDIAARGIDVKGIAHVINYDIPATTEDYIHRIGRTARASATGEAITFVTPDDLAMLRIIERDLGKKIPRVEWDGAVSLEDEYRPTGMSARRAPPGGFRITVTRGWK